jgi:hypothetical protein
MRNFLCAPTANQKKTRLGRRQNSEETRYAGVWATCVQPGVRVVASPDVLHTTRIAPSPRVYKASTYPSSRPQSVHQTFHCKKRPFTSVAGEFSPLSTPPITSYCKVNERIIHSRGSMPERFTCNLK